MINNEKEYVIRFSKVDDITNMSREILKAYINDKNNELSKSDYIAPSANADQYEIYGV